MPEQIKQAEKEQLDRLRSQVNTKVMQYGQQSYIVDQIERELESERERAEELRDEIDEVKSKYDEFVQKLYQKYGDVAVDLDTGDIVSPQ
jgi:predicted transcriptional regulator